MASTPVEVIRAKFETLKPIMDERTRRLWAATEAKAIGRGGITRVSQATVISHVTIRAGLSQLGQPPAPGAMASRERRPGGGRKMLTHHDPGLLPALESQVEVPFAEVRRSYTKAFERYALDLSRRMTIRDVAVHLGVGWDVIKDIQKRDPSRRYARPKLKHLRRIAIDEIAVARGHRYLTVVLDLESGAVVFVGDGKGADALKPFWKRLRPSKARIEAVAMDMSAAYRGAVLINLPGAKIVFDRFHVVKLFNEKLSELRRTLHREATDVLHKQVLKGTRWLLLKNPEDLDEEKDEKRRLEEALALNRSLATAYYLKEDLRRFWERPSKRFATAFLDDWIKRAEASGIKILRQMARTLAAHRDGLLAYYDVPITSGPMEGTNNKIKTMKRMAYGFRDREFFKLKILAIHETKYELVG